MQALHQNETKTTPTLSFGYVNRMSDPARFWMHEAEGTVYVFDRHTSEIFEIADTLAGLIEAGDEREFNTTLRKTRNSFPDCSNCRTSRLKRTGREQTYRF
jgi:hypothetical protein